MGTMAKRPDERLIEFLTGEFGEDLRGVYWYDSAGIERLWPATRATPSPAEEGVLDRCIEIARNVGREWPGDSRPAASRDDGLVWLVDDQVVVLLPGAGGRGFVATADRRAELPLTGFVESCRASMQ